METPGNDCPATWEWEEDIKKLMDTVNDHVMAERERCVMRVGGWLPNADNPPAPNETTLDFMKREIIASIWRKDG